LCLEVEVELGPCALNLTRGVVLPRPIFVPLEATSDVPVDLNQQRFVALNDVLVEVVDDGLVDVVDVVLDIVETIHHDVKSDIKGVHGEKLIL